MSVTQALLVCEAAQKRSSVYAATRFACCALYGMLGAAGPAATNFDALAIKHIQHDSITGEHTDSLTPELSEEFFVYGFGAVIADF